MPLVGLVGAHRTGKTTLCDALNAESHYSLSRLHVSISEMQKEIGFDSSIQSYPWHTRKKIQEHLLARFDDLLYSNQKHPPILALRVEPISMITERTPIDLIGYALLNAPDYPSDEDKEWIAQYIKDCIDLTNRYYEKLFLLQPGIAYVACDTSAGEDSIDKLHSIYLAQFLDSSIGVERYIIPEDMLSLHERIKFVKEKVYDLY